MSDAELQWARNRLLTNEEIELWRDDKESPLHAECPWEDLVRSTDLIQGLYDMGFDSPSKIQCQAIPVLAGQAPQSLIAQAPSGSGKTVAFLCCLFLRVDPHIKELQGICLTPTLELSQQSYDIVAYPLNEHVKLTLGYAANKEYKVSVQDNRPQILIGTPAGVIRAIRDQKLDVSHVQLLILDEADKLLYPRAADRRGGDFISDVKRLLRPDQPRDPHKDRAPLQAILPPSVTVGFFSASFTDRSINQCKLFRPGLVELRRKEVPRVISHLYRVIPDRDDPDLEAQSLIEQYYADIIDTGQAIVFLSKHDSVDAFARGLNDKRLTCRGTHGGVPADERMRIMADFRNQKFKILVGTDLLARGIDVPQVYLVIQVGISRQVSAWPHWRMGSRQPRRPPDDDRAKRIRANFIDYQHRAGRAGRFGRSGISFSIIQERERRMIEEIAKEFRITIHEVPRGANIPGPPQEQPQAGPPQPEPAPPQPDAARPQQEVAPPQPEAAPPQVAHPAADAAGGQPGADQPAAAAGQPGADQAAADKGTG
jgi:ATP-dependent RNA helicase DDX19/DBP5